MKPQSITVDNLLAGLRRLHPRLRKTRLLNWALLVWGLLRARSAKIPAIAAHLPLPIQAGSREKRLWRWLDNSAIDVTGFFAPVGRCVLKSLTAAGAPIRLLIDRVELSAEQNLLVVCVAYRRRAFPLVWCELGHRGACTQDEQIALLKRMRKWIPKGAVVYVVADREFRGVGLAGWIGRQHWNYILRLKCDTGVEVEKGVWSRLDELALRRGPMRHWANIRVALRNPFGPTHLVLYWGRGYREPWYLLTNVADPYRAIALYRTRIWCEELWRDWPRQGFNLQTSAIVTGARLERLLLGIALAAVWALWTGAASRAAASTPTHRQPTLASAEFLFDRAALARTLFGTQSAFDTLVTSSSAGGYDMTNCLAVSWSTPELTFASSTHNC